MRTRIMLCCLIIFLCGCSGKESVDRTRRRSASPSRSVKAAAAVQIEAEHAVRITSSDFYDSCPCWSPDGKRIAYCSSSENRQNIWTIGLKAGGDGKLVPAGNPEQITTGALIDQDLSWSLDGEKIIFSSNRNGKNELFTVTIGDRKISAVKQEGIQPRWSPQGKKVVFVDMNNVWTMIPGNEKSRRYLTISGFNEYPCWSSDSQKLIFSSSGDLFSIYEDSCSKTPLTSSGWNNQPDWSVVRNEVVFVSNRSGDYDLWKVKPDGSDPVQLTKSPLLEYFPRWSPDGKWVAFQANYKGSFDIWIIPVNP